MILPFLEDCLARRGGYRGLEEWIYRLFFGCFRQRFEPLR